jgi:hypothetical protein
MNLSRFLRLFSGVWVIYSATVITPAIPASAEILYLGITTEGQSVEIDTDSVQRNGQTGSWGSNFTYYLGGERIPAGAHCGQGIWNVDGQDYSPQSQATRNMISLVCSIRHIGEVEDLGSVLVYDPPSNVRSSPGGSVVCTLENMTVTSVYVEPRKGWYSTRSCGGGWIHESQIRPLR